MADITICDLLVIGGGSAGCIVAKRLRERSSGRVVNLSSGWGAFADEWRGNGNSQKLIPRVAR